MKQIILLTIFVLIFSFVTFAQAEENNCPKFVKSETNKYSVIIYSIETNKVDEKFNLRYKWMVEGGKILFGDNTKSIVFLVEDSFSVNVKIEGLPKYCAETQFGEAWILDPPFPRKIDQYNKITKSEEVARLENLFVETTADPTAKAYIKLRDNTDLTKHLNFLNSHLKIQSFNTENILFAITKRSEAQTEIWIVPNGAKIQDCEDCLIFPSKDFDKLKKLFQTKAITKKYKN